jgi:hypothetical protein
MSEFGRTAEDIYSQRVFRSLTDAVIKVENRTKPKNLANVYFWTTPPLRRSVAPMRRFVLIERGLLRIRWRCHESPSSTRNPRTIGRSQATADCHVILLTVKAAGADRFTSRRTTLFAELVSEPNMEKSHDQVQNRIPRIVGRRIG